MYNPFVKLLGLRIRIKGYGVVNNDGAQHQKILSAQRVDIPYQRHNNVTYAKGTFIEIELPNGKKGLKKLLKISPDCLRAAIFAAAHGSYALNISAKNRPRYVWLAQLATLLRGHLFATTNERKTSCLTVTGAVDPNAVITLETFSSSVPKVIVETADEQETRTQDREDGDADDAEASDKKGTGFFCREVVGDTDYTAEAIVNIDEVRFVSCSDIFGRRAIRDDAVGMYVKRLSAAFGSEVSMPKYYRRRNGACDVPERGILLTDDQVVAAVRYLMECICAAEIRKSSSGYARVSTVHIRGISDPLRDYSETTNPFQLLYDANSGEGVTGELPTSYYCDWLEVSEEQALAELSEWDAELKTMTADTEARRQGRITDKKAKATAKKAKAGEP